MFDLTCEKMSFFVVVKFNIMLVCVCVCACVCVCVYGHAGTGNGRSAEERKPQPPGGCGAHQSPQGQQPAQVLG